MDIVLDTSITMDILNLNIYFKHEGHYDNYITQTVTLGGC